MGNTCEKNGCRNSVAASGVLFCALLCAQSFHWNLMLLAIEGHQAVIRNRDAMRIGADKAEHLHRSPDVKGLSGY